MNPWFDPAGLFLYFFPVSTSHLYRNESFEVDLGEKVGISPLQIIFFCLNLSNDPGLLACPTLYFAEAALKTSKPSALFPFSSYLTAPFCFFFSFGTPNSQASLGSNNLHTGIFLFATTCQLCCRAKQRVTRIRLCMWLVFRCCLPDTREWMKILRFRSIVAVLYGKRRGYMHYGCFSVTDLKVFFQNRIVGFFFSKDNLMMEQKNFNSSPV